MQFTRLGVQLRLHANSGTRRCQQENDYKIKCKHHRTTRIISELKRIYMNLVYERPMWQRQIPRAPSNVNIIVYKDPLKTN